MITLIYGSHGFGKTTAVVNSIAKDTKNRKHTFLIVPEQETVQSERQTLLALPSSAQLYLEVLNFSRLYNRVCREYGGLSYQYITKPVKSLLMWQNLRELAPLLEKYGDLSLNDSSMSDTMIQMINEFKSCGITAEQLESVGNKLPDDEPLRKKLRDLSLIYASFDNMISQGFSDSADDLSRLEQTLKKHSFFKDCNVYIDSFTSFTAVEHRVIERIFADADNVTVTVPLPSPRYKDISTEGIIASLEKIKKSAEKHGGYKEMILTKNYRALSSPSLAYLSENLWKLDVSENDANALDGGSIVAEICDNPYSEAEAAANHVLELLRQGARCRDIAVIMRDATKYKGIIEPAFEKNGIPFFFSEKTDLCTLPPVKLILTALRIKQYNCRKNDVISHIKTGLCDISPRSSDLFEEYINTWNIQGARFLGDDWTMNPDGFVEERSQRGEEILKVANQVRRKICEPLERFFIFLEASEGIPDMCRAVYKYIEDIGLEKKLSELANKELERNQVKRAKETSAIYGVILNSLADIANALPDSSATTEEFISLLKIVFGKTDIGTIPTSVDEVTIGSASTLRTANPKYTLVLGLCEGEFPAAVSTTGLLAAADRTALEELGLELSGNADTQSSDELMYVHRAFSSPTERLFVFTSTSEINGKQRNPSLPFLRIKKLFPELKIHKFDGSDLSYLTPAPRGAASQTRLLKNTSDGKALKKALEEYIPDLSSIAEPNNSASECTVSESITSSLFGSNLGFSATSFETYVKCPFNYYCTYVLGLREKKSAKFQANIIGTFVHYILEELLKESIPTDPEKPIPTDEELIKKVESSVSAYVKRIYPKELGESKKLNHLYKRLTNLAFLLIRNLVEEFSHSKFRPIFFELKANGKDGNPSPLAFTLDNGCKVTFKGIIDRVDIFRNEGEVYLRVVDYKTGSKHFSFDDVRNGLNVQMLLYLFTICRSKSETFRSAIGVNEDKDPIPAGAIYLSANIPIIEAESYEDHGDILKKAENELRRSGVILNDEDILLAMNDELSPRFLAGVKRSAKGEIKGAPLVSSEAFGDIFGQLEETIIKISNELVKGIADASPMQIDGDSACRYCNMKPICRKTDN